MIATAAKTSSIQALDALAMPGGARVSDSTIRRDAALLGLGFFVVLVVWAWLLPWSGEGDAILHYLNARDARLSPWQMLHTWARPVFKLLVIATYPLGPLGPRVAVAALSGVLVYQTVRLAQQVGLPRPLSAAWMLMLQPFFFGVAGDILSEAPFALGAVLAVRLWLSRWSLLSCLIIGFLPLVRPEGFLFGLLWGVLVLIRIASAWSSRSPPANPHARESAPQLQPAEQRPRESHLFLRSIGRLVAWSAALGLGLLTWSLACWCFVHHATDLRPIFGGYPLYWVSTFWPPNSYDYYPSGNILYHVYCWPVVIGLGLFWPFVIGLRSILWPRMRLVWAAWLTVFVVHSVLFWGHWFASAGLLRIFACTAPFAALIATAGWDYIAQKIEQRRRSLARPTWRTPRAVAAIGIAVSVAVIVFTYFADRARWYGFLIADCTNYLRRERLTAPGSVQHWFFGNRILEAELNLPAQPQNVMPTVCEPPRMRQFFRELPIGAVGVWDNQQAQDWHAVTIEELLANGFTLLYETTSDHMIAQQLMMSWQPRARMRFVVLRKDGAYRVGLEQSDAQPQMTTDERK